MGLQPHSIKVRRLDLTLANLFRYLQDAVGRELSGKKVIELGAGTGTHMHSSHPDSPQALLASPLHCLAHKSPSPTKKPSSRCLGRTLLRTASMRAAECTSITGAH